MSGLDSCFYLLTIEKVAPIILLTGAVRQTVLRFAFYPKATSEDWKIS